MNLSRYHWLLPAAVFYACHQPQKTAPIPESADYKAGQSFLNHNDDSAFYYFNKVVVTSCDSLQIAMACNNMALIQADKGDYFGSQETLLLALKYLDEHNQRDEYCLLSVYNQLGRNSSDLKNYPAAIGYYDTALRFSRNPVYKAIALNNKAVAYQHANQYTEAIKIYQSVIDQSKSDKKEYARILSNLAKTKWLQNPNYPAAAEMRQALELRKEAKDEWGLNASYAHLSDFYSRSNPDSAFLYANKMYTIAQKLGSPDDELEALQKLITSGPPASIRQYFQRYRSLSDSLETARNAAKNQFALIRYESEKNKADALRFKQDDTEKRIQVIRQRIVILTSIAIFILAIVWIARRAKARKESLEQAARTAIREGQLNTSRKVHDIVANGLYRIMARVEHQDAIQKEQLLDEIETLYEQSRDISHEQPTPIITEFQDRIVALLSSFSGPTTKIAITGNEEVVWEKVSTETKAILETILQELLVNMKKHSGAEHVVIKFEQLQAALLVQYIDDGVGLPSSLRFGNGLTSTETRIKSINGSITFERELEKGTRIQLHIPTS